MSFTLAGLGTAVPDAVITLGEGLAVARCFGGPTTQASGFLPAVYEGTGNRTRYFCIGRDALADVLAGTRHSGSPFLPTGGADWPGPSTGTRLAKYAADAPPLALEASRKALAAGDTRPADVTHLVTVSCTGFAAPGVDHALITGLELNRTVERVHVGFMGCHGAINGLRAAAAFARDPAARVLVCAVELCSLHYHYGDDPGKVVANALFADGAAAAVNGGGTGWTLRATGSCLVPGSAAAMGWMVGDHGFEMTLARAVPGLIARSVRPWLDGWLGSLGLAVGGVGSWCVHPGGPKILDAVQEGLGLPPDALAASRAVFADYGNMSSPTVLFVLDRLRALDAPRPCVMLGFGPGLTAEAAVWV